MATMSPDNSADIQDRRDIGGIVKTTGILVAAGVVIGGLVGYGAEAVARAHGVELGPPGALTKGGAMFGAALLGVPGAISEGISRIRG